MLRRRRCVSKKQQPVGGLGERQRRIGESMFLHTAGRRIGRFAAGFQRSDNFLLLLLSPSSATAPGRRIGGIATGRLAGGMATAANPAGAILSPSLQWERVSGWGKTTMVGWGNGRCGRLGERWRRRPEFGWWEEVRGWGSKL
ncbi:unnamed protein product [Linum tenue]|uniref:Uncharacterized protein n=1 Tax=Linum tenue TaxID=586396 RepID=A0AAV0PEB8_9ROSI|nr:unnamed protein product [Linum tenue]